MKIKIAESNTVKIQAKLDRVNRAATTHTFTVADLIDLTETMQKKLDKLLLKKDQKGVKIQAESGENVANSYSYSRIVNAAKIERGAKDWFLVSLKKTQAWTDIKKPHLVFTKNHVQSAHNLLDTQYRIID